MTAWTRPPAPRPHRGAALLVAMVVLTVVATLSAGMVWQQYRAVQVEAAERSRQQAAWILMGALDWARLILREHRGSHAGLNDAWAQPLAEARLSTFLAADRENNADLGPDAFLSGAITDAQSRYNLNNLVAEGKLVAAQQKLLERLCQFGGLPSSVASLLAEGMLTATVGTDATAALLPQRIDDLLWLGLDRASLEILRPWVTLLPQRTKVNLNTAPREVLAAVIEGIDLGVADRLVQARQREPFKAAADAQAVLPSNVTLDANQVDVRSDFFEVRGRLRVEEHVLDEQSLVHKRSPTEVITLRRERWSGALPGTRG